MDRIINIFFDSDFEIDKDKLQFFLNKFSKFLKFKISKRQLKNDFDFLNRNESHIVLYEQLKTPEKKSYLNFYFSTKQYNNNYFFIGYDNLVPVSFYGWEELTTLPYSNGVLYFMIELIALELGNISHRHYDENTGCIFDFKGDKRGVDDGMRQARFCQACLNGLVKECTSIEDISTMEDLKSLMNELSNASKWNRNILDNPIIERSSSYAKRKSKEKNVINIVIASPSDLVEERSFLLDKLERKFRIDKHEENCNKRLIVNAWEDLSSQNGYAQDIINKKILQKVDIVLAIFKHKLGTELRNQDGSLRAQSGTAEEILFALDESDSNSPIGMVYFYSKPPVISLESPDLDKIKKEWESLKSFKDSIKDKVLYKPYSDKLELLDSTCIDLVKNIKDNFE